MTRLTCALLLTVSSVFSTSAVAADFSGVTSGLLLGVYASPGQGGMRVNSTIPGYSAQGRLFPGDVLLRATMDGWTMYNLRSHHEMENAKMAIGPGREAAVEIWRPGHGMIYAWVEFTPLYSAHAIAYSSAPGVPQPRMQNKARGKASFRMETEKPGARQLFLKKPAAPRGPSLTAPLQKTPAPQAPFQKNPILRKPVLPRVPTPGTLKPTPMPKFPVHPKTGSNRSAANLFNR